MPYPFPGMNPYLEGYLWPDVHSALANKIRQMLVPKLRPHYTARLDVYLIEDITTEGEIGILYPDVEILKIKQNLDLSTPINTNLTSVLTTPVSLTLPVLRPVKIRIPTVEIRDTANNTLVTSIEILSPVNKREPGLSRYQQKCQRLYNANVHLIELDLLRRGTRHFHHPQISNADYLVTLTRAQSEVVNVWTVSLQDSLPIIPIPLRPTDADIPLHLQNALNDIYDEAAYDLSIDYSQPPPPPALSTA